MFAKILKKIFIEKIILQIVFLNIWLCFAGMALDIREQVLARCVLILVEIVIVSSN